MDFYPFPTPTQTIWVLSHDIVLLNICFTIFRMAAMPIQLYFFGVRVSALCS